MLVISHDSLFDSRGAERTGRSMYARMTTSRYICVMRIEEKPDEPAERARSALSLRTIRLKHLVTFVEAEKQGENCLLTSGCFCALLRSKTSAGSRIRGMERCIANENAHIVTTTLPVIE